MLFVVYSHVVCCLQTCCLLFTAMLFVVYSHVVCCSQTCCLLFMSTLLVVYIYVLFCFQSCFLLFITAMFFVVTVMLFAAILIYLTSMVLGQASTPYIDYTTCYWDWQGEGVPSQCLEGYIAIGACYSANSASDCNNNAAGTQCCRIKGQYSMLPY